jgi:hypothetical protein
VADIWHTHLAQKKIHKGAFVYVVERTATAQDYFYGMGCCSAGAKEAADASCGERSGSRVDEGLIEVQNEGLG